MKIKHFIFTLIIAAITGSIINGFKIETAIVKDCTVFATKHVTAHFSGEICGTEDGESYCESSTWSEPASDTWRVTTVNNQLKSTNTDQIKRSDHGYFVPNTPDYNESWSTEKRFKRFEKHSSERLRIKLQHKNRTEKITKNSSFNNLCNDFITMGKSIEIKTWYGITYDTEI